MGSEFYAPSSLEELQSFLANAGGRRLTYLAGGTDLVVDINERRLPPWDTMIYLDHIPELKEVWPAAGVLNIGSCVTHETLGLQPEVRRHFPLLSQAAATVGSPAIRTMGTIGGNIARSSPAGDVATALLALEAEIHTLLPEGRRQLCHQEFHLGPRRTGLLPGELITHFTLPLPGTGPRGSSYEKLGQRKALTIAIVNCGVFLELEPDGEKIRKAAIALGSVGPTPFRAARAESLLTGWPPSDEVFWAAAEAARESCRPIADIRAGAEYRKDMVRSLVLRNLRLARQRALA